MCVYAAKEICVSASGVHCSDRFFDALWMHFLSVCSRTFIQVFNVDTASGLVMLVFENRDHFVDLPSWVNVDDHLNAEDIGIGGGAHDHLADSVIARVSAPSTHSEPAHGLSPRLRSSSVGLDTIAAMEAGSVVVGSLFDLYAGILCCYFCIYVLVDCFAVQTRHGYVIVAFSYFMFVLPWICVAVILIQTQVRWKSVTPRPEHQTNPDHHRMPMQLSRW
jgi:hypothetical protein